MAPPVRAGLEIRDVVIVDAALVEEKRSACYLAPLVRRRLDADDEAVERIRVKRIIAIRVKAVHVK